MKGASGAEAHGGLSEAVLSLIAHELNNIAVPLGGFSEHALQHIPGDGVVRECIQEFQMGIGRIRALASDLESLGDADPAFEVIALADCIGRVIPAMQCVVPPIEWSCPQELRVRVDPLDAQRAITALIRIAVANDSTLHPGALTITQKASRMRNCAVCGANLRRGSAWVFLRTSGIRRFDPDALRDPFGSYGGGRISYRLALAVLDRCAHRAGGHVSLDQRADLLTLVLPVAG